MIIVHHLSPFGSSSLQAMLPRLLRGSYHFHSFLKFCRSYSNSPGLLPWHESRQAIPGIYRNTRLRIALIGRPNVGKSTLFNRLAGSLKHRGTEKKTSPAVFLRSVVDALPGVTRDPREANGVISDLLVTLVDTPGLEHGIGEKADLTGGTGLALESLGNETANSSALEYRKMYKAMEKSAVREMTKADLVLFVVDCKTGVTGVDREIGRWLRSSASEKNILLVANKCDVKEAGKHVMDGFDLGFGDPLVVSGEQGLGFADLYRAIDGLHRERTERRLICKSESEGQSSSLENEMRASYDDELVLGYTQKAQEPLRQLVVSIIGRPNVGKSTLLNRLVGEDASLVGPVAGVTRDAVLCEWKVDDLSKQKGHVPIWLIDTAGMRSEIKVEKHRLESLSVKSSLRALIQSHVVMVVVDAREPLVHQDVKLLDIAVTYGRAVVIVVNKMDTIKSDMSRLGDWRIGLRYKVDNKVSELSGVETVEVSAKEWTTDPTHMTKLFNAVQRARTRWEKRIPTSALNRFVAKFNEQLSVGGPVKGERRNRIGVTKFITQKKIRPPMFRLDGSSAVSLNYVRSLTNAIRQEFGFQGVPIRVKRPSRRKRR